MHAAAAAGVYALQIAKRLASFETGCHTAVVNMLGNGCNPPLALSLSAGQSVHFLIRTAWHSSYSYHGPLYNTSV